VAPKPADLVFPHAEVLAAVKASARENGWAVLPAVRLALTKSIPGFDRRHYGGVRFVTFLKRDPNLEFNEKRDAVRIKDGA
jgi:hypothetical protein